MQTKRIAVYVANSTQLPYLDVRGTYISMDSTPDGWLYSRSASTSVTTYAMGPLLVLARNEFEHYPVWHHISKTIACSIVSHLDYCNALYAGLSEANLATLQRVQNTQASVTMRQSQYNLCLKFEKIPFHNLVVTLNMHAGSWGIVL